MTRPQQTEREKTLLWVTDNPTERRALIEESAREFKLGANFCAYGELWSRAERSDIREEQALYLDYEDAFAVAREYAGRKILGA